MCTLIVFVGAPALARQSLVFFDGKPYHLTWVDVARDGAITNEYVNADPAPFIERRPAHFDELSKLVMEASRSRHAEA